MNSLKGDELAENQILYLSQQPFVSYLEYRVLRDESRIDKLVLLGAQNNPEGLGVQQLTTNNAQERLPTELTENSPYTATPESKTSVQAQTTRITDHAEREAFLSHAFTRSKYADYFFVAGLSKCRRTQLPV